MKGIILAAGRGSRLNDLTDNRPKPLVDLAGKTLFEWQLSALAEAGVEDISAITGYLSEQFSTYSVNNIHNDYWATSNMVRSLLCADNMLSIDECIVSYGDIVYHPDIVRKLLAGRGDIIISYDKDWFDLWSLRFDNPLDDAESFAEQDGVLLDIGRTVKNLSQISGQYMGLLLIRPNGWQQIKKVLEVESKQFIDKLDMTALLQSLLADNVEINTVQVSGHWLEVDDPDDLAQYQQMISQSSSWLHDWRW